MSERMIPCSDEGVEAWLKHLEKTSALFKANEAEAKLIALVRTYRKAIVEIEALPPIHERERRGICRIAEENAKDIVNGR